MLCADGVPERLRPGRATLPWERRARGGRPRGLAFQGRNTRRRNKQLREQQESSRHDCVRLSPRRQAGECASLIAVRKGDAPGPFMPLPEPRTRQKASSLDLKRGTKKGGPNHAAFASVCSQHKTPSSLVRTISCLESFVCTGPFS